jgi:hypothetical protein
MTVAECHGSTFDETGQPRCRSLIGVSEYRFIQQMAREYIPRPWKISFEARTHSIPFEKPRSLAMADPGICGRVQAWPVTCFPVLHKGIKEATALISIQI